jgi:cysteine desulfurase/selenocysteine lyase
MRHYNYKHDFPALTQCVRSGHPLVFLDSAASSQKPQCVIDAITHYYQNDHANVHRGVYELSARATQQFEAVRTQIQHFIHARHAHEIIFVRGTTEGINLIAHCVGQLSIVPRDEIIISAMEHHSNIVPWQWVCEQKGAVLKVIPLTSSSELDLAAYQQLLSPRTKMVAVTHVSNVLGTINPIQKIIEMAHAYQAQVLVDGAQAFPHMPIDVQALDCDFYVFSSHKAYGPTGVGVLYGKEAQLNALPPYQGGGDMIETVTFEKTTYNTLPYKFEAGTPNIASVIGWGAALRYLKAIGMSQVFSHEQRLLAYANTALSAIPGFRLLGGGSDKVGVLPFTLTGIHPHDVATVLDQRGIAVRAGHHCAMPLMEHFGLPACVRASFALYNDEGDIDTLVEGVHAVQKLLA